MTRTGTIRSSITRHWPSALAFVLVAVGTMLLLTSPADPVESRDRLPTVVVTGNLPAGASRAAVLGAVELRDLETIARPAGALQSLAEIPEAVLVAAHVPGQPLLDSSFAPDRVATIGPGYVAVSVRLDPQRWVGPLLLTGATVAIYDVDPEGPRLISPGAVVVEAVTPEGLDPRQDTILSLGVRLDTLADVLAAAAENRLWLVGG